MNGCGARGAPKIRSAQSTRGRYEPAAPGSAPVPKKNPPELLPAAAPPPNGELHGAGESGSGATWPEWPVREPPPAIKVLVDPSSEDIPPSPVPNSAYNTAI